MTQRISEKDIEHSVSEYAKRIGMVSWKFTSPSKVGVPDRIFLHNGRTLFIEFKAPSKVPTTIQRRRMNEILDQGVAATWVDSVKQGREILDLFAKSSYSNFITWCEGNNDF